MTNYLGIDISKKTLDCCLLFDSKETYLKVANTTAGHQKLLRFLNNYDDVHICMEATGCYWQSLAACLGQNGLLVSVENPAKIRYFSIAMLVRLKTDKQDALVIARYCEKMQPKAYLPESVLINKLRNVINLLQRLRQLRAAEKNSLQTASPETRYFIEQNIEYFDQQIKTVGQLLKTLYKEDEELYQKCRLLTTIPAIGTDTALLLASLLGSQNRFTQSKQFVAYLGLNPRIRQSGSSLNTRAGISKMGSCRWRSALYMPAMVAYSRNLFPEFIRRMKAKGKPTKVIIIALMRKLAVYAFTIFTTNTAFNVN